MNECLNKFDKKSQEEFLSEKDSESDRTESSKVNKSKPKLILKEDYKEEKNKKHKDKKKNKKKEKLNEEEQKEKLEELYEKKIYGNEKSTDKEEKIIKKSKTIELIIENQSLIIEKIIYPTLGEIEKIIIEYVNMLTQKNINIVQDQYKEKYIIYLENALVLKQKIYGSEIVKGILEKLMENSNKNIDNYTQNYCNIKM